MTTNSDAKSNLQENNSNAMKKLDNMFLLAEDFAKKLDNDDPGYINCDDNLLQNCIDGIWSTIYGSAISTFINSIEMNYEEGRISQHDFNNIKPTLSRWGEPDENNKFVDQQQYSDFQNDLRAFSQQYPKWNNLDEPLIEHFQKNLWRPYFEKYSSWAEDISKRYELFLQRKNDRSYVLVKTNYAFISPYEFEELVADLFKTMGYCDVIITPKSCDYGIDIIVRDKDEVIGIQAKKYAHGNNVGNRDVQRLLGAMQLHTLKANKGILITTSDFTVQAIEQAKEAPIELWNGKYFNTLLLKYLGGKHKK